MITIQFNKKKLSIADRQSLQRFLSAEGYRGNFFAVILNHQLILRTEFDSVILKNSDVIEIIMPMAGG